MPASSKVYREYGLRYVRIEGVVDPIQIKQLADNYHSDPDFSVTHRQLIDLCALDDVDMLFPDVMKVRDAQVKAYGPLDELIKVAVAAPTDVGFGMARMFQTLMQDENVMTMEIFPTLEQAMQWLGGEFPPDIMAHMDD